MQNLVSTTMSSSKREGENLSARLARLRSFCPGTGHVWDIGCDHGLLGLSFSQDPVTSINLVDPSAAVIENLKHKLRSNASYITKAHVFLYENQGQKIKINSINNTVFIAGMGGEEIGLIVSSLLPQLDQTSLLVISPHRKVLELRKLLGSLELTLLHEEVLAEDGQFYPILVLAPGPGTEVHPYGEKIWEGETGTAYREQQLLHFGVHRDEASLAFVGYLKSLKSLEM